MRWDVVTSLCGFTPILKIAYPKLRYGICEGQQNYFPKAGLANCLIYLRGNVTGSPWEFQCVTDASLLHGICVHLFVFLQPILVSPVPLLPRYEPT